MNFRWLKVSYILSLICHRHPRTLRIKEQTPMLNHSTWLCGGPVVLTPSLLVEVPERCIFKHICLPYQYASRFGLAIRREAGKQRDLGSNPLRLSFLFKGCGLWTLSCDFVPHN